MSKQFFAATSTLIGTIIGAGILGLPFVIMTSGFGIGLLNLIVAVAIMVTIQLYLGEIGLRTKTNHHITGYAEKYLGKKGKMLMFIAFAFGIYSALVAYLIGEGDSFSYLFFQNTQYSFHFGITFWFLLSGITYFGLNSLKKGEKIGAATIFLLIALIIILNWNKIDVSNLTYNNPQLFYFPFGVALFALLGFSTMPEVERILGNQKKLTKKTIITSYLIILAIYIAFILVVVGTKGDMTPALATLALGKAFIFLGMITMFTSYLALTIALIDTLQFDFNKPRKTSWIYTISIPLIIFILLTIVQKTSFIKILGIGGVVSGGLMGALILLMVKNAKKKGNRKPEYSIKYSEALTWTIIIILAIGTFLELWNSF